MTNNDEERMLIVTKAGVDAINEFIPVKIGWEYLPLAPKPQQHTDEEFHDMRKALQIEIHNAFELAGENVKLQARIKELTSLASAQSLYISTLEEERNRWQARIKELEKKIEILLGLLDNDQIEIANNLLREAKHGT